MFKKNLWHVNYINYFPTGGSEILQFISSQEASSVETGAEWNLWSHNNLERQPVRIGRAISLSSHVDGEGEFFNTPVLLTWYIFQINGLSGSLLNPSRALGALDKRHTDGCRLIVISTFVGMVLRHYVIAICSVRGCREMSVPLLSKGQGDLLFCDVYGTCSMLRCLLSVDL